MKALPPDEIAFNEALFRVRDEHHRRERVLVYAMAMAIQVVAMLVLYAAGLAP